MIKVEKLVLIEVVHVMKNLQTLYNNDDNKIVEKAAQEKGKKKI